MDVNVKSAFQISGFNTNTYNSFDMSLQFEDGFGLQKDEVKPDRKRSAEEIMKVAKNMKAQKNTTNVGKTLQNSTTSRKLKR